MKKGLAVEGFIREDGTAGPLQTYDDTELRGKIQKNVDDIDNLKGRVTYIEEHGGGDDTAKADKVTDAVTGNFAGLDSEGNLTDSGKKAADFADKNHSHGMISIYLEGAGARITTGLNTSREGRIDLYVSDGQTAKTAIINKQNMDNLNRALQNPDNIPAAGSDNLIKSKAVYQALGDKMDNLPVVIILTFSNALNATNYALVDSSDFTEGSFGYLPITKHAILRVTCGSPTAPEETSMLCSIIYKYDAEEGEIDMSIYAGGYLLHGTYDINDAPTYLELTKSTHDLLA